MEVLYSSFSHSRLRAKKSIDDVRNDIDALKTPQNEVGYVALLDDLYTDSFALVTVRCVAVTPRHARIAH